MVCASRPVIMQTCLDCRCLLALTSFHVPFHVWETGSVKPVYNTKGSGEWKPVYYTKPPVAPATTNEVIAINITMYQIDLLRFSKFPSLSARGRFSCSPPQSTHGNSVDTKTSAGPG